MNNEEQTDQSQSASFANEVVHFLDYWQIIYSRKEIIIAVALLMTLTSIVITRQMPRLYAATTIIRVQHEAPNVDVYGPGIRGYDPIFLRTQFQIIKSTPVMEQVVRELNLDTTLGREYGWVGNRTPASVFERTVGLVKGRTSIDIIRDTDLLAITVKLDKPSEPDGMAVEYAANIANTLARVYLEWTRKRNESLKEVGMESIIQEIANLNRSISEIEEKRVTLRQMHDIIVTSDVDVGNQTIRTMISELNQLLYRAEQNMAIKKLRSESINEMSSEEVAASINVLVGDTSLLPLLAEKQKLEIQIDASIQASLGPSHPDVIQSKALLASISDKIEERVSAVKLALKLDYGQAQTEYDMLRARLAQLQETERTFSFGPVLEYKSLGEELINQKRTLERLTESISRERINLRLPSTSVEVIDYAKVPETKVPVSPNFALNITLGVIAGLFFGIVIVFFVEYLDTTIKSFEDIEKYLGLSVIGVIPQKMKTLNSPSARSSHSEVYRVLRMNLKSSKRMGNGKVIVITSGSAGEGKSITAFNLAYASAEVGDRILLVDGDLHRPRQHKILNIDNNPGLCNVIVGEIPLDDAIQHTDNPNLDILVSGHLSGGGVYGLMDTDEMANLLQEVRNRYDRIIVDSPPIIGVSDTIQLARLGDGVALVVQHRKYARALCKRAKDMLINMGGNVLGVIFNNINVARGYSSYYYQYQYYYYYGDENSEKKKGARKSRSNHKQD